MEPKCDQSREADGLLSDISPTVKKLGTNGKGSLSLLDEAIQNDVNGKEQEKETFEFSNSLTNCELKTQKEKKFRINKSLLTFRITQFLWYGAGTIPSLFLGIFFKQRGLSIVEISSAFSLVFLFQFLSCSVTGIITDKIGNAKPVLMFLMISSSSILVSMSLTPNVNNISCSLKERTFNDSNQTEIENEISSCYMNCSLNNEKHELDETNYVKNFTLKNSTLPENQKKNNQTKIACNVSNFLLKNGFHQSTEDICCNSCINKIKTECITVRKEYLVVVYAALIVAFYSVWNATYRFLNFIAITLTSKNDSNFGRELFFAKCGNFFTMAIISFVLNIDKSSGSKINFDPVFWFAAGIIFCACISIYFTNVPILPPGKQLGKKAFSFLKNIDILAFVLLVFMAGNGFAFNYTFHLVFLETINPPRIVVALHSMSMVIYGFLTLLTSEWWLKKFGTKNLFILCLMFYTMNFTACSYLQNPWWILVLDISIAFTYDLFWVAVVIHCFSVAPVGFVATLNALTGSVHYGIGRKTITKTKILKSVHSEDV